MVNADGDPARHLRHGETILATGDVIRVDSFSFTRPDAPFVGFEYGSQVLLAFSHRLGDTGGVVVLTTLVIAGTLAGLSAWLLRRGVDPLLVALATTAVAVLTNIHWLARPHVFSWPLILLLLAWLERDRRPPLWAFGVLFAGWANLHGAFVFGWVMIGMYLAGHLLESRLAYGEPERRAERHRALRLVPALLVAMAATLLTPYGWRLPWHVVEFFRDPWIRTLTQEFQSPNFNSGDLLPFLAALGVTGLLLAHGRCPHWTRLVAILGTSAMGLIAQRNIVMFGLVAGPLLAIEWNPAWVRLVGSRPPARRFAHAAGTGRPGPYIAATVAALAALVINGGRVGALQVLPKGFEERRFPVATVEQARAAGLSGRLFHDFVWGGYLLWAWPEQKVFIDPGTDHYGGALLRAQRHVVNLQAGWADSLKTWDIDLVLVPSVGAMAAELKRESAWVTWYADSTATLFRRTAAR
jgi:hypothetical protein